MTACEECWTLAWLRSRTLGGSQADHYRELLAENEGKPGHGVGPPADPSGTVASDAVSTGDSSDAANMP